MEVFDSLPILILLTPCGVTRGPKSETTLDNSVLTALVQSSLPKFLPHISKLSNQEVSESVIRAGTSPFRTSDSPTTLRACSSARGPGLPSSGCPSGRLLPSDL
jgi:hypothetical protein